MSPRVLLFLLLAALLAACPTDDDDSTAVDDDDDVAIDDDDAADDDDSGSDDDDATDDDDSADVSLDALTVDVTAEAISTRETVSLVVTAHYSDGGEVDVTDEAELSSSDEAVIRFYSPPVGQPLAEGSSDLSASWGELDADPVTVAVTLAVAGAGDLVINELLVDGAVDGDPNGDGSTDAVEDEFLVIANAADAALDLSGVTISELDFPFLPRHTFADGSVLGAGEVVVVFGGGDVSALDEDAAWFVVAENEDPGIQYGLSLKNDGDVVTLTAADGATGIAELAYGDESDGSVPAPSDQSAVLEPEVWGADYVLHEDAASAVGAFSPGVQADASPFEGPDGRYGP